MSRTQLLKMLGGLGLLPRIWTRQKFRETFQLPPPPFLIQTTSVITPRLLPCNNCQCLSVTIPLSTSSLGTQFEMNESMQLISLLPFRPCSHMDLQSISILGVHLSYHFASIGIGPNI